MDVNDEFKLIWKIRSNGFIKRYFLLKQTYFAKTVFEFVNYRSC